MVKEVEEKTIAEKPSSLAKGLVHFQQNVPAIEKKQTAKIPMKSGSSYSYQYADLGDIWEAIRKPLAEAGLAVTQALEGGSDGHTTMRTIIWHECGEKNESAIDVPTQGKTPQEAGSLFTYYKRYALSAALGISTEEDDDATSSNDKPTADVKASPNKPASESQLNLIRKLASEQGLPADMTEERIKDIKSSAEASEAISKLKG